MSKRGVNETYGLERLCVKVYLAEKSKGIRPHPPHITSLTFTPFCCAFGANPRAITAHYRTLTAHSLRITAQLLPFHSAFTVFHRTFATYRRMLAQTPIPKNIPTNRTVQFPPKRSKTPDAGLIQAASKKTTPLWSKYPPQPRRPPTPPRAQPITSHAIPVITGTAPHLQPISLVAFSTLPYHTRHPHKPRPGNAARMCDCHPRKSRDPAGIRHRPARPPRKRLIPFIHRPTRYLHGQVALALSFTIRRAASRRQQKPYKTQNPQPGKDGHKNTATAQAGHQPDQNHRDNTHLHLQSNVTHCRIYDARQTKILQTF